jgi:hypothetical protein
MSEGLNARFVRTAKRLLLFQVAASALAVGLAGWAAIEVADLVDERDRLTARVAELEAVQLPPPDPAYQVDEAPAPALTTELPTAPAPTPPTPPRDAKQPPPPQPPSPPPAPPPTPPPAPPPAPPPSPPPAPPPPPTGDCQRVDRRPVACVPPFRRTPASGVCLDGRNRLIRCPAGVPREPPREPRQKAPNQQSPNQQPQRPPGVR